MASRAQTRLKQQAKKDSENNKLVLQSLMSHVDGRRWAWLKLGEAMIFQADADLDPQHMAWRAGMRNSGLKLLAEILDTAPQMFTRMWEENSSVAPKQEETEDDGPDSDS